MTAKGQPPLLKHLVLKREKTALSLLKYDTNCPLSKFEHHFSHKNEGFLKNQLARTSSLNSYHVSLIDK
jgi:hypothetical protein